MAVSSALPVTVAVCTFAAQLTGSACLQWMEAGGRPCRGHLRAQEAGIGPRSLCQLHLRLRGGGGDGGATGAESRVSYLEMYMGKKADKVCCVCKLLTAPADTG